MPGYCVQGTIGHKILNGQRKLEMEGRATVRLTLYSQDGKKKLGGEQIKSHRLFTSSSVVPSSLIFL